MTPTTIFHLTELCMSTIYFAFEDDLYEQIEGAPMGLPLSPVLADLYVEHFDSMTIEKAKIATLLCR